MSAVWNLVIDVKLTCQVSNIPREFKSIQQGAASMLVAAFDPSIAGKVKGSTL